VPRDGNVNTARQQGAERAGRPGLLFTSCSTPAAAVQNNGSAVSEGFFFSPSGSVTTAGQRQVWLRERY